jgi:hypothetical protein
MALAVAVRAGAGVIGRDLVPIHRQRRKRIALIAEAKVGRRLDEQRPAVHPGPELIFLVRIKGEVAGAFAVTLEEARQGLSRVHDAEEAGIMDQLLVAVR